MAAALSTSAKNSMLTYLGTQALTMQAGFMEATFTLNDTQSFTWGTAATSKINISANIVFNLLANETVNQIRLYAAAVLWATVDVLTETFATAGTYTLTKFEITLT